MTANECIKGRRSIRKFTEQPVSAELIKQIVETASFAPSWKNTQVPRYIAVSGSVKEKIAAECTSIYGGNAPIINGAPVVIVQTVLKNRSGYERDGSFSTSKEKGWQMYDAGIAAEAFCLAAYEQGIGSVVLGLFDYEKVAALLNIDESQEVVALIPIGYPAEQPICPRRKTVDDLLTFQS